MERLTNKRLAIPPGQWQEVTPEDARELKDIPVPSMWELYYRLSQIEDILGDDYDLDRLSVMCNQRMTMREEVSQRFSLTAKIPLDRLREIAEADMEGRCVVLDGKSRDKELIRKLVRLFYWLEDCVKKKDFSPFRIVAGAPEINYPFISAFQHIENEYELEIYLAGKDEEAEAALAILNSET